MKKVIYEKDKNRYAIDWIVCERIGDKIRIQYEKKEGPTDITVDKDNFLVTDRVDIVNKWLTEGYSMETLKSSDVELNHLFTSLADTGQAEAKAYEELKIKYPYAMEFIKKCVVEKGCIKISSWEAMGEWSDSDYKNKEAEEMPIIRSKIVEEELEHIGFVTYFKGVYYRLEDHFIKLLEADVRG